MQCCLYTGPMSDLTHILFTSNTMVGEWVGYIHSCDSLQVNRRIHLLCQGTVHSEGVHFDTVQTQ